MRLLILYDSDKLLRRLEKLTKQTRGAENFTTALKKFRPSCFSKFAVLIQTYDVLVFLEQLQKQLKLDIISEESIVDTKCLLLAVIQSIQESFAETPFLRTVHARILRKRLRMLLQQRALKRHQKKCLTKVEPSCIITENDRKEKDA